MELKDIKDILTFAAFRPEADNPNFGWPQRFPKRKSINVNVNRGNCTWAYYNKKGEVERLGEADGDFPEVVTQMADEWKNNTEDGWIGVSLNNRFIISLEHNLPRKKGWEDDLRTNPKSVLGSKYDRSKKYAIQHNPETSASLVMACDDSMIKTIEESLRSANLRAARIACGLFATTSHLLNRISSDAAFRTQDLIIVTWVMGSLCVVRQKAGQWKEVRCRSGLPLNDESAIQQMIKPFLDGADGAPRALFMGDQVNSPEATPILNALQSLHVTDVTEVNNFWNILGKY